MGFVHCNIEKNIPSLILSQDSYKKTFEMGLVVWTM